MSPQTAKTNANRSTRHGHSLKLESLEQRRLLSAAPQLLFDIPPIDAGSAPHSFSWFSDTAYFRSNLNQSWYTDGVTGASPSPVSLPPHAILEGKLYNIGPNGELLVRDGPLGPATPFFELPLFTTVVDYAAGSDHLYYVTRQSVAFPVTSSTYHLWSTDGTPEGTTLLHTTGVDLSLREVYGDTIFYVTPGQNAGVLLHSATGTLDRVHTLVPSPGTITLPPNNAVVPLSASIGNIALVGNDIYFTSSDGGLWKVVPSSGPPIITFPPSTNPTKVQVTNGNVDNLIALGSTLFFTKDDVELWRTGGSGSTFKITNISSAITNPPPFTAYEYDGFLYFSAVSSSGVTSLRRTDGASTGTTHVASIGPASVSPGLQNMSVLDGYLYFSADDTTHGRELWKSDGTLLGTHLVRDINAGIQGSNPGPVDPVGGLFQADDGLIGQELWRTDGTSAGTFLVENLALNPTSSNPQHFVEIAGTVYFQVSNGSRQRDLWQTDGTNLGTHFVQTTSRWPGTAQLPTLSLKAADGKLYFIAPKPTSPVLILPQLWSMDPDTGVSQVIQPNISNAVNQFPADLTTAGETLFFTSTLGFQSEPRRVWRIQDDGSVEITGSYSDPKFLGPAGISLFFADGGANGLWRAVGTTSAKIANVTPVGYGIAFNGFYYFPGWTSTNGVELWRTNGTTGGTVLVRDINLGDAGSNVHSLVNVGGTLFFVADHEGQPALWKSNGTSGGTLLVRDVPNNERFTDYGNLTAFEGQLYFAANDGVHGIELWRSDGTAAGTTLVYDLRPGESGSEPQSFFAYDDTLYFSANDGIRGRESYVYAPTRLSANTGGPYFTQEGQTISLDASGSSPDATLFEWDLDNNGSFETVGQTVSFSADDDGTYLVTLRVTAPAGTATDTTTIYVENLAPVARAGGVLAGFTDLPSNLRLWADDPSPVDQATGFDFEVDFDGDGTVDDVFHGPSGMLVSHTFSASDVYHPLVTAIDKDGGRSEAAEHRIVIIDAMREPDADQPLVTNLVWTGTNGDDHVVFTQTSATTVLIELHQLNGVPLSPSFRAYMFGINGRVIADGLAGNDLIDLSGVTTISAEIFGGLGQDTIFGTQAADVIYTDGPSNTGGDGAEGDGGEGRPGNHVYAAGGDDVIYGSRGRDYLDAGAGRNLIHAGRDGAEGRDTLIGAMADDSDTTIPLVASSTDAVMSEFDPLDAALADWNDHDPIFGD